MAKESKDDRPGWWDGNSTRVWRVFVLMFIGLLSFISSWMFNNIAGLSDKFVTKADFQCVVERLEKTIDGRFNNLDSKVDEQSRYLRDLNRGR